MARDFDLLGDPIPDNHGKPGANGHVPNAKTISKVRVLLVSGLTKKEIARALGISTPTLSKHYFNSGRINLRHARDMALAEQKAKTLLRLDEAADAGNVSAMKAMRAILQEEILRDNARDAQGGAAQKPTKAKVLSQGKKAQLSDAAQAALDNDPLLKPGLPN